MPKIDLSSIAVSSNLQPTLSLTNFNNPTQIDFTTKNERGNWTIMYYMDGDIDLEQYMLRDFNNLEKGYGSGENVTIIVLFDRIEGYSTADGNWNGSRIYKIESDTNIAYMNSTLLEDWGEVNMGDSTTLTNFLDYCFTNFPADKTMLVLSDHGSGLNGLCYDYTSPEINDDYDRLTLDEVQGAISTAESTHGIKLDIIFLFACVMGMIEVAYEFRGLANYLLFSEEIMWSTATYWSYVIEELVTNSSLTPLEFLEIFVSLYGSLSAINQTISVIDLNAIESIIPKINSLSSILTTIVLEGKKEKIQTTIALSQDFIYTPEYIDLSHFLKHLQNNSELISNYPTLGANISALLGELNDTILINYRNDGFYEQAYRYAYGLSIFLPNSYCFNEEIIDNYLSGLNNLIGLDWLTNSFWDDFLAVLYSEQQSDLIYQSSSFMNSSRATDFEIYSSPIAADIDCDGEIEKLIASNHQLVCYSDSNTLEWIFTTSGTIQSIPAIADIDLDNDIEILFGSSDKKFYCLSSDGQLEWSYKTNGLIMSSPCLADLDGDKKLEILFGSRDQKLYCLDSSGDLKWSYLTQGLVDSSPSIADLNSDSKLEVIFSSNENQIYCLTNIGELHWNYTTEGDFYTSSPVIADLDLDGYLEVIVGCRDCRLYCLNYDGSMKWLYQTRTSIFSTPTLANIDADPEIEILVNSYDSNLYCLDATGQIEWVFKQENASSTSPCIADLNNDGIYEILSVNQMGYLNVINNFGLLVGYYRISTNYIQNKAFHVMNMDADDCLEILIVGDTVQGLADVDGNEECLTLNFIEIAESGISPWYSFKGNLFHTGWMDTDGDWLDDFTEEYYLGTDPNNWDTDGDLKSDGEEYFLGTNPLFNNNHGRLIIIVSVSASSVGIISLLTLFLIKRKNNY